MTGTGAVVVCSTSRFNLSRLCRVHNHINQDRHVTCTCFLCHHSGILSRITRGQLRTVGRFARLKSNFGVTVHSLRVHNTNGLLNQRRRNGVTDINFTVCYRVLRSTVTGTRANGSITPPPPRAIVRVRISTFVSSSCVRGNNRGVRVCRHLTILSSGRRLTNLHRRLTSHCNGPDRPMRGLLRIARAHLSTGTRNLMLVTRGGSILRLG